MKPAEHDHLEMMKSPDRWPLWPVLPLKRRCANPGEFPECAFLMDVGGLDHVKVYLGVIYELGGRKPSEFESKKYSDYEAVVADGWIVD